MAISELLFARRSAIAHSHRVRHKGFPLRSKRNHRNGAWAALATALLWREKGDLEAAKIWLERAKKARAASYHAPMASRHPVTQISWDAANSAEYALSAHQLGVGRYATGLHC